MCVRQNVDENFAPVFIVGFPRTGTTLLYSILYRHPLFQPAPGRYLQRSSAQVEAHFFRRFFRPAVELWSDPEERSLREWFAENADRYTAFLAGMLRQFHLEAAEARGVRRILEKTPDNLLLCYLIHLAFPSAYI